MLKVGDRVAFKKCDGFYGKVKTKLQFDKCEGASIFEIMFDDSNLCNLWMWENDLIQMVVICA